MRKNAKVWLVFLLVPVLVLAVSSRAKRDSGGSSEDLRPVLEAYELIRERYYDPDSLDEKEILKAAIEGMLDELPDDYNVVYDEEEYKEYQEELEGNYVGVGMEITAQNDAIEVVSRFPGTPSAQGGIEPGDLILSVDGKSTEDMSVGDVSDAIKGEAGT
ncbi:PDZ domain-containing protein, partial [Candidatus Bipolaricaulota bacterium]|nr:PDZ domain-containing protein [Candidatus Bipolaricaulota bacterium]